MADKNQIDSHVLRQFGYEIPPEDFPAERDKVLAKIQKYFKEDKGTDITLDEIKDLMKRMVPDIPDDETALKFLAHPVEILDFSRKTYYKELRNYLSPQQAYELVKHDMRDEEVMWKMMEEENNESDD